MTEDREYWEHHFKEREAEKGMSRGTILSLFALIGAATLGMFWLLFISGWAH